MMEYMDSENVQEPGRSVEVDEMAEQPSSLVSFTDWSSISTSSIRVFIGSAGAGGTFISILTAFALAIRT